MNGNHDNQMDMDDNEDDDNNERVNELLVELRELSPDQAVKVLAEVTTSLKKEAHDDLVDRLKETASSSVRVNLVATKKKIDEMMKAKRRIGELISEEDAAELVFDAEEEGIQSRVRDLLELYHDDLFDTAMSMIEKKEVKKRERTKASRERKNQRDALKKNKVTDSRTRQENENK